MPFSLLHIPAYQYQYNLDMQQDLITILHSMISYIKTNTEAIEATIREDWMHREGAIAFRDSIAIEL